MERFRRCGRLTSAPESNLSVRPTRLIGRTTEVAEARQALVTHRLVTVSAVGGSGKTRLAVEVGEQELNHRSGGVWFVDLTSALSSGDVAPAVAAATRLRLTAGDPTEQVVSFFADKASLVILDNCEHVIDGCAEFAEAMLAAPGETVLLATSREALDVDGEQVMHLGSLTATGADGPSGKRSPAVELFVERAIAIDPSFSMTGESASTVAELCERLDGMPLAIELAAARVTVMSPDELLAGLEDRFNLLSGGRRRQRQRTLEATLDWSYNLLDADLQRVFRALGVFVGGFDIDAVAATADITRSQSIDAIEALVAKSLVVRTERADVSRFGLLETLKAYSEDRLIQAGEAASVRDRHAAHFHRVATVWGRRLGHDVRVGRRLRHDHSNLSAAIDWFANNDQWVAAGELLLGAHASYQSYGSSAEAVALGHRVETPLDNIDPALADFIRASEIGALAVLADFVAAIATAEQLLESESLSCRVEGFRWLGFFWAISSPSTSMQLVEQARRDADTTHTDRPDPNIEAALAGLEFVELAVECYTGDYQNALDRTSRWVDEISQDGVLTSMDLAFVQTRAGLLVLLGDPANALAQLDEFADYPFQFGVGGVRALAHLALGDIDAAREHTRLEAAESMAGRLRMQANETVLVLAALAEVEGERNVSIDLVLKMGVGPSPIATASGRELASRLGVGDSYAAQLGASLDPSGDDFIGVRTAMTALRAEVARRGW